MAISDMRKPVGTHCSGSVCFLYIYCMYFNKSETSNQGTSDIEIKTLTKWFISAVPLFGKKTTKKQKQKQKKTL